LKKGKILLADDSPTILAMLKNLLEKEGYETITASNGIIAAEKAYTERPDLILLDIVMPGMNGYQVCRLLKNDHSTKDIPIVILTSKDQAKDRYWGFETGADQYLTKDSDSDRLIPVVEETLEKKQRGKLGLASLEIIPPTSIEVVSRVAELMEKKLFESTILNTIGKVANSIDSFDETIYSILNILTRLLDFTVGSVAVLAEDKVEIFIKIHHSISQKYYDEMVRRTLEALKGLQKTDQDLKAVNPKIRADIPDWRKGGVEDWRGELWYRPLKAKGKILGILAINTASPTMDESKTIEEVLDILTSQICIVIDNARLYREVKQLSLTDPLTRLSNRHHFHEELEREFSRSRRHDLNLSLIMIDIDHFKRLNDAYGHLQGDAILKELAKLLKDTFRDSDILGRFGGEEFSIILPMTNGTEAMISAERLRKKVEEHSFPCQFKPLKLTVSLGVSHYPREGVENPDELIKRADEALYRAKKEGRNRVCWWEG